MKTLKLILLLTLLFAGCQSSEAPLQEEGDQEDQVSNQIREQVRQLVTALNRGEPQSQADYLGSGFSLMRPGHAATIGRDPSLEVVQQTLEGKRIQLSVSADEIELIQDTAIYRGRYSATVFGEGQDVSSVDAGNLFMVFRERGGDWQLEDLIWNSSIQAQPVGRSGQ